MKRNLLFAMLLAAAGVNAQTTHMISWFMGVTSSQASITIDQGDIVTWTWDDTLPHTVTSQSGMETFNSGTLTGSDKEFSHTFTMAGSTTYHCQIHASMQGTITVQAVAGVKENEAPGFKFYPNPTSDVVTISAKNTINRVEVYDLNGRLVMQSDAATPVVKVYLSGYAAGTYLVKAFSDDETAVMQVIKK